MEKQSIDPVIIQKYKNLSQLEGQTVTIEGIYQLYNPYPSIKALGGRQNLLVRIVLNEDEDNALFLEPFWDTKAKRPMEERNSFEGKKVQVTGTFHSKTPLNPKANGEEVVVSFGGSYIYPVAHLELVTE